MNCSQCGKPAVDLYAGECSDLLISYPTEESPVWCVLCAIKRVKNLWAAVLQSGIMADGFLEAARKIVEMEQ